MSIRGKPSIAGAFEQRSAAPAEQLALSEVWMSFDAAGWIPFVPGAVRTEPPASHCEDRQRPACLGRDCQRPPILSGTSICAVAGERVLLHTMQAKDGARAATLGKPPLHLPDGAGVEWVGPDSRTMPQPYLIGVALPRSRVLVLRQPMPALRGGMAMRRGAEGIAGGHA